MMSYWSRRRKSVSDLFFDFDFDFIRWFWDLFQVRACVFSSLGHMSCLMTVKTYI